jgi:hypothetical protein
MFIGGSSINEVLYVRDLLSEFPLPWSISDGAIISTDGIHIQFVDTESAQRLIDIANEIEYTRPNLSDFHPCENQLTLDLVYAI